MPLVKVNFALATHALPTLDEVDFGLSIYAPSLDEDNFALLLYAPPALDAVDFELSAIGNGTSVPQTLSIIDNYMVMDGSNGASALKTARTMRRFIGPKPSGQYQ